MDKENMFGTLCIRPPGSILMRKSWMYVIDNLEKGIQERPVTDLLSLERAFIIP